MEESARDHPVHPDDAIEREPARGPAESDEHGVPRRVGPLCHTCDVRMHFAGGRSTHDLWAERFVCGSCGRETYRSYGRGSV